jgi:branched-chain amino acid aminotransferase
VIVWCNGRLVPAAEARLSPIDHGLMVGDGVFETLRVHRGIPFAWRRHIARLGVSAAGLELPMPEPQVLRDAADQVIAANGLADARLRITITGGPGGAGSHRGDEPPTVLVVAVAIEQRPFVVDLVTLPWPRNELSAVAGIKTISYAENVRALLYAKRHGADDGLFCDTRGRVCEATSANVFVVRERHVRTPSLDAGCLPGVTRALLLEACERLAIRAEEADLTTDDVRDADEALLSSSVAGVRAVRSLDGAPLLAAPGPVTTALRAALDELMDHSPDP